MDILLFLRQNHQMMIMEGKQEGTDTDALTYFVLQGEDCVGNCKWRV